MPDFFNNKIVAITGGSDGIGKSLVDLLISQGAKVGTPESLAMLIEMY